MQTLFPLILGLGKCALTNFASLMMSPKLQKRFVWHDYFDTNVLINPVTFKQKKKNKHWLKTVTMTLLQETKLLGLESELYSMN